MSSEGPSKPTIQHFKFVTYFQFYHCSSLQICLWPLTFLSPNLIFLYYHISIVCKQFFVNLNSLSLEISFLPGIASRNSRSQIQLCTSLPLQDLLLLQYFFSLLFPPSSPPSGTFKQHWG